MDFRKIPFSPPDIGEGEIEAVAKVLRSGWITTGPETKRFEKMIADYCKTEKAVCLNSATASLELNLRVLGIEEGDEVLVPAYTYTASVSAAIHVGAKIVFIDSQPGSFEMDYDKMEAAITKKTKAVIAVDLGGVVCDYGRIYRAVENKKNLFVPSGKIQQALGRVAVIADGAHSLGAERDGTKAGSIADFTSFSFHAVKNLTTAEGGAATWKNIDGIDNEELYRNYQLYSLHGQSKDALAKTKAGAWEYDVIGPWYKCNMTDIMSAIGICQLERYDGLLERRKEIILKYNSILDEIGVEHLSHYGDNHSSSGHLYITRVPNITSEQRNEIINEMAQRGISCNVHYKPLPMMTAYKNMGFDIADYPNAYAFFANEITLPLHTKLTDEDVEYVISNYKEVLKKYL
ncbi:MAG: DegT/DnrJ/EryC1/StrS family aminotransferase [Clostridia bacterium]|nr:DegT/DnrJ/EryC1/StrS family aminotransferase [Clostridia bacterium]